MRTKAANDLLDAIKAKAEAEKDLATFCAVRYAEEREEHHRAGFHSHTVAARLYESLHGDICRALHAVEQELSK